MFRVFLGVFRVFGGCSGFFGGVPVFFWECSGFLGAVPGFSGVPECSVMFRCSGVPCSGVPGSTTCRAKGRLTRYVSIFRNKKGFSLLYKTNRFHVAVRLIQ